MSVAAVLLPLFVLVAVLLVALLPRERAPEAHGALDNGSLCLALLFATLTALALFTRKADLAFVILGWIFVAARVASAFPALAGTALPGRRVIEMGSVLVLALMWVLFALAILLNV